MAGTDFTLATNQEILKWFFGKTTLPQPTLPLHVRWMAADDSTSLTPGTEVSAGAASRINLNYANATATNYSMDGFSIGRTDDMTSGSMMWTGPSTTITGNEIWDSSATPRRICYDKGNSGFTVNTNDMFEWDSNSSGIALQMMGFEAGPVAEALNFALGRTTGWTRPQGPFKIKLKQYDDFTYGDGTAIPKATLEAAPMQPVTFGAVEANGDHQAVIRSDINVVFPSFSSSQPVIVQGYEIWDSSSTPRKLCTRKPGMDTIRDQSSFQFVSVPAGNSLTIPLGTLKFTLGRGDGSG